jgi:hypothetical protein
VAPIMIGIFIGVIALIVWVNLRDRAQKNAKREAQRRFIETYAFPAALKQKLYAAFPTLSTTQIEQILEGLRQWFALLHNHRSQKFGMPSKAVDTAWHEFILLTRQYQSFCNGAFGEYLHHAPNAGGSERRGEDLALARTYALAPVTAIVAGGAVLGAASATGLFDIDRALGIEGGYVYDDTERAEMMQRHAASQQAGADGGSSTSFTSEGSRSESHGYGLDGGDSGGGGDGGGGCGGGGCGS